MARSTSSGVLVQIVVALITALATVGVAYFQYVLPQTKSQAKVAATNAVAAVEIPVAVNNPTQNETDRPLFLVWFCGAAHEEREIEALIGDTPENLQLVSSTVGSSRISFSVIVPSGWYYRVRETSGRPCQFRGWKI